MGQPSESRAAGAFCLFTSGSMPLGVALEAVAEVVQSVQFVPIPLCPRRVLGLCTYRGRSVPVIDPGPRGERRAPDRDGDEMAILVLRTGHGFWGFAIDRRGVSVEERRGLRSDEGPPIPGGFVAVGAVERDGIAHVILDPERSWRGLRSEIDRWYRDARGLGTPRPLAIARPG